MLHHVVDLFSAILHWPFLTCACALLCCSSVMCAVCGCKSIIHRHMHSFLWNLSIIDSASPTVEMVRGLSISMTHYWACVWVCACEHLGVYAHVKKRLERGWRKTHNVRKEHGAVQCKVRSPCLSVCLSSLFLTHLPHGFLVEIKELYSPLSAHSLPSIPSIPPSLFIWLHFCHFLFFYSPPLSPSFLLLPGCFAI